MAMGCGFSGGGGGGGAPGPQGPQSEPGQSAGFDFMSVNATTTYTLASWQDAGDAPQIVYSWTVGTSAGMIGARFQMYAETSANTYYMGVLAHSGSATATPPWEA